MLRQLCAVQARRISTASSPYDNYSKLRALPFHIHPERAQEILSPLASLFSGNLAKFLPSLGACALPFLNFDFLRPARFSAVYFPAWFVTGDVEASVTYKGVQVKENALFDNTYIPGSHVAVLSAAPLRPSSLVDTKTVPFSTHLLHQHGEPVQCIPFSTSPFSVLDIAASHPPSSSITINESLSIDPSSVKPNLISAYPVLLPLYLAQYELQGRNNGANMFTFILKANEHSGPDIIMFENLSKIDESPRKAMESLMEFFGQESSGEVNSLFPECPRVSMSGIDMTYRKNIKKPINEWLEELLCSSANIEVLAESSLDVMGKGDEDLRIREMSPEEELSLKAYTDSTENFIRRKRHVNMFLRMEREIERDALEKSVPNPPNLSKERKILEEWITISEAERARFVPKWWSEWLALNRPQSENTESGDGNAAAAAAPAPGETRSPPKDSDKDD